MRYIRSQIIAAALCFAVLSAGCAAKRDVEVPPEINSTVEGGEKGSDTEQILQLLGDYGAFRRGYIDCRTVRDNIDKEDSVTVESIRGAGAEDEGQPYDEYYYRVIGDITTEAEFLEAAEGLATEDHIENEIMPAFNSNYTVSEGNLYLREGAGYDGTTLGVEHVYLDSAEKTDTDTLSLTLTATGGDVNEEFTIKIDRGSGTLKIDECAPFAADCLSDFQVESRL